jgi:hypothetical protein
MRSGLRHHIVWYMGINVTKEHSGSVFPDSQKLKAVCPDRNLGTHELGCTVQ